MLSNRRIIFFVIIVALMVGSAYLYIDYSKKKKDPCHYETYANLMARFPELKELSTIQRYQLKIMEARHELQSEQIDSALKRGTITAEGALSTQIKLSDELLRLSEQQTSEFNALCRKLLSQSKD